MLHPWRGGSGQWPGCGAGCPHSPSGPDDCPVSSAACLFRVNALSLVYLLFLLLLPWFPGPSRHSIRGKGGQGSVGVGCGFWGFRALSPDARGRGELGPWLNRAGVMFSVVEEPLVKDEWS